MVAEDADEDDEEEQRQDQSEEAGLAVAEDAEQVIASLVHDEDERAASGCCHDSLLVSCR